jgi:hypothetical protein
MKSKLVIASGLMLLSVFASAADLDTHGYREGLETADELLSASGKVTDFVSGFESRDGKLSAMQKQVFEGTRVVKSSSGKCREVASNVVDWKTFTPFINGPTFQLPTMQVTAKTVDCTAHPKA